MIKACINTRTFQLLKSIIKKIENQQELVEVDKKAVLNFLYQFLHEDNFVSLKLQIDYEADIEEVEKKIEIWLASLNALSPQGTINSMSFKRVGVQELNAGHNNNNIIIKGGFYPSYNSYKLDKVINVIFKSDGTGEFIFCNSDDAVCYPELLLFKGSWTAIYYKILEIIKSGWNILDFPFEQS